MSAPASVPYPQDEYAERLRRGTAGHMEDAAVRLLLCLRRAVYASPAIRRYVIEWTRDGRPAARIVWAQLADAVNRDMPPLPFDAEERRMLAVACSLGGAAPVSLSDALNARSYVARLIISRALRDALQLPEVGG